MNEDKKLGDGGKDNRAWSMSEIIRIHDCPELEIDIGKGSSTDDIQQTVKYPLLLVENVEKLHVYTFDVGIGWDKDLEGVSYAYCIHSIHFGINASSSE